MLGQFLEFSVDTSTMLETVAFYRALGFEDLETGDMYAHAYAALGDRRIAVGLHAGEPDDPVLTFVRPDLAVHLRTLRRSGIDFEFSALAEDEFHRAGFTAPHTRQRVALVEARTFSPATRAASPVTGCGEFLEYSVSTSSVEEASPFWEGLGFERVDGAAEPHRWLRLRGHGLTLGLHETLRFRAAVTFRASPLGARVEYLRAKGFEVRDAAPVAPCGGGSAMLRTPDGAQLHLLDDAG